VRLEERSAILSIFVVLRSGGEFFPGRFLFRFQ
jgi:hypothetical protein